MTTKTEQKVLDILAANPGVWVPNLPRTMPGVRCSTIHNLRKNGLIKQGRDEGQPFFGYKLVDVAEEEMPDLVLVPHPEDPYAIKADAEIVRNMRR